MINWCSYMLYYLFKKTYPRVIPLDLTNFFFIIYIQLSDFVVHIIKIKILNFKKLRLTLE